MSHQGLAPLNALALPNFVKFITWTGYADLDTLLCSALHACEVGRHVNALSYLGDKKTKLDTWKCIHFLIRYLSNTPGLTWLYLAVPIRSVPQNGHPGSTEELVPSA
jgi:hypothetical protein